MLGFFFIQLIDRQLIQRESTLRWMLLLLIKNRANKKLQKMSLKRPFLMKVSV